jgi:CRP-like cAMP-binding protein/ABC-type taurine transport system ATPase subunit
VLPTWIKSLQLSIVSGRRIDDILNDEPAPASEPLIDLRSKRVDLTVESLGIAPGSLVGLVTTPDIDIDTLMSIFSGNDNPQDWRMTTDGHLIRLPHVNPMIQHVTAEPLTINASPMTYLRGVVDDIEESRGIELMQAVGLHELVDRRFEEIGPAGNRLTVNQRQRLALACALAAAPDVLLIGPILALADAETAMPLIASLRGQGIELIVIATRDVDVAHEVSRLMFADNLGVTTGSHQDLLVNNPRYARLWEGRLLTSDVDLSVLGLGDEAGDSLYAKLVTEHFEPGTPLYRTGDPADRVIFVISGHIEISTRDADGNTRRVAVLAPGMHCGDLRLTVGEKRAEDATAVDNAVVRSLSRGAISAGMSGMLDRTPTERKIVSLILRAGSLSVSDLEAELSDLNPAELRKALDLLRQDGAIREVDGLMSVVQKRAVKSGAAEILDRIGGL